MVICHIEKRLILRWKNSFSNLLSICDIFLLFERAGCLLCVCPQQLEKKTNKKEIKQREREREYKDGKIELRCVLYPKLKKGLKQALAKL